MINILEDFDPYEVDAARDRVLAGAEWLDDWAPAGWWDLINLETLDVNDINACVLGQVFIAEADTKMVESGYGYALRFIDQNLKTVWLGFSGHNVSDIEILTHVWAEFILKRRAEVSA